MGKQYLMNSSISNIYSLTPMQEGMLYHNIADSTVTNFVIQNIFDMEGNVSERTLIDALALLSQRYDVLRTAIIYEQLSIPRQVVLKKRQVEYQKIELLDEQYEVQEAKMNEETHREIERGFDLQKDMLLRVKLFDFGNGKWKMAWTYHHIIIDGWCLSLLYGSFLRYYNLLADCKTIEEVEVIVEEEKSNSADYGEYIKWIEEQDKDSAMKYWAKLLDGYDENAEIKPLRKPEAGKEQVQCLEIHLDHSISRKLLDIGVSNNSTISSVVETAWGVVLQKYSYTQDVVFGKVDSGRNAEIRKIESIVGLFINTIPTRIRCTEGISIEELIRQVQKQGTESNSYSYCSLSEIQGMTKQKSELIKTLFVFENYEFNEDSLYEDKNKLKLKVEKSREQTNFGITLIASLYKGKLLLKIMYNPQVYAKRDIEEVLNRLETVLNIFAIHPELRISEIEILSSDEKKLILHAFNNTDTEYKKDKTIHQLFEEQAEKFSERPAILYGKQVLTYRELNEKANSLARVLRQKGVKKDTIVAIMAERSLEMMIGIYAILKAGGAYLPISPDYPEERKDYLIKDSGANLLLFQGQLNLELKEGIEAVSLEEKALYENDISNLDNYDPNGVAYIIYTSGSTGQPKGVMVEHHSVVNRISWMQKKYPIGENDVILQKTTYTFDVSVWELFWWSWYGAKVALLSPGGEKDPSMITDAIEKYSVTTIHFVPSMFTAFLTALEDKQEQRKTKTLKQVFTSGEALGIEQVNKFYTYVGNIYGTSLINLYGPTEATVDVSYFDCADAKKMEIVPIGKPIDNTKLFIIDKENHLQPVGIPGELVISGVGLARGYLGRKELTAQKFVDNPFAPGEKMYFTGDLARWLPDGNIDYLGRLDDQVKIRGIRIELGEIENTMEKIQGVRAAAVIVREDENHSKSIHAYYVTENNISTNDIRTRMEKLLPNYMVPSYIMQIEKIPVTANGKLDRKALPKIEIKGEQEYVEPRNDIEKSLCNTFAEILGIKKVGIRDSFFELGGDSIRAIRIVSKMRAAGYKVSVKEIMNKYTVEAIAYSVVSLAAKKTGGETEITGEVTSTPIIKLFEEWNLSVPQHFNQDVLIEINTDDELKIRWVLKALAIHHDMIRSVYRNHHLEILSTNESKLFTLRIVDLRAENNMEEKMQEECTKVQESIELENGPLLKTILFKTKDGSKLFLCIHHLIVDSVSWRILVEDFKIALKQVLSGKKIELPAKTDSFKKWSEALKEYQTSSQLLQEKPYWERVSKDMEKARLQMIRKLEEIHPYTSESIILGEAETTELIYQSGKAFGTNVADILLSALGIAVKNLTGQEKVSVELEGHGREEIHKKIDIDRTVGWFTTKYPIVIECVDDMQDMIISTKEIIRRVPNHGIGYGVLREQLASTDIDLSFNYLGILGDESENNKTLFYSMGKRSADKNIIFKGIIINSYVVHGKLTILISYNKSSYDEDAIRRLRSYYQKALIHVIRFCTGRKEIVKTVSDYSSKDLSNNDFGIIHEYYKLPNEIEDIYGLTPLQEGMLFYHLANPKTTEYVIQNIIAFQGKADAEKVGKAINLLVQRYPVLRTAILYEKLSKPRQVVLKNREAVFEIMDLCEMDETQTKVRIEELKEEDLEKGFDIQKDSLIRVKFIRCSDHRYKMIWTHHHIILDGWCLSLIYGDFKRYYNELAKGRTEDEMEEMVRQEINQTEAYSEYIKWLENQNKETAIAYWKKLLEDYDQVADIKPMEKPDSVLKQVDRKKLTLNAEMSKKIEQLASESKVTVNSLIEAAYGIILQNYNFTEDVVYGKIVSGRNVEVRGIENIVGMFINTIPVRVKISDNTTVRELLTKLKEQANESSYYDYCSLAEIQAQTEQKSNLIKVLYAFENYYVNEEKLNQDEDGLQFIIESGREQTNYALTLSAYMESGSIVFDLLYNQNIFAEEEITGILEKLQRVLEQFIQKPDGKAADVDVITDQERARILYDFNDTDTDYQRGQTVNDLFEALVDKNPEQIAVVFKEREITYEELNKRVNQLAQRLRKSGMHRGDIAAVITQKSIEMIVAILGTIKAGGAYVPIDPTYPKERINFILSDCKPVVVLTYGAAVETDIPVIKMADVSLWEENATNPEKVNEAEDLAYIIYTSGTTGKPKGVQLKHSGLTAMKYYLEELYQVNTEDNVLQFANYIFDASVWEITISLLSGSKLVIIPNDIIADVKLFNHFVKENNITLTLLPPQYYLQTDIQGLKVLTTGGSASHPEVVRKARNNKRYINAYGPTENTVLATHWEADFNQKIPKNIPIGRPISNTRLYILNGKKLCPPGVPGELCIVGEGVANGYLNRPELTQEKFTDNPFESGKLYHTGDLVRWLPDGNIEYLDRIDEQVKIRGFRIELGEIENAMRDIKQIMDACVIVKEKKNGDKLLYAYYVPAVECSREQIIQRLKKVLPEYMIPVCLISIEQLPVTKSGKIDKKKLPMPTEEMKRNGKNLEEARSECEKVLVKIWKEILDFKDISIHDNFFDIGGNSLLIIRMLSLIQNKYPDAVKVGDIFANPTISKLAEFIESQYAGEWVCRQIPFPKVYMSQGAGEYERTCSFDSKGNIYQKIYDLLEDDEKKLCSYLAFAFSYLVMEETENRNVSICMGVRQQYCTFSLEAAREDDLNILMETVEKEYAKAVKKENASIRIESTENGMLPLLLYECQDRESYHNFFDFTVSCMLNENAFTISLDIRNRKLNRSLLNSFFEKYITLIENIFS